MALRSVLDINVNDAALDRLQQKIEKYQQTARNLPQLSPTGRAVGLPGARGGQTEEERAVPYAERLVRAWGQMRDHSREVVRNVREMAQRFLSLTGLLGVMTGTATGFGFLGFDKLAQGAAGLRQQSASNFTTIGGLQAARIGLGRFGDVNAMLSGLGTAAQTPGSEGWKSLMLLRGTAQRMGLQGFDVTPGEDAVGLLEKVLPALQGVMQRTPQDRRGLLFQQLGLDKILGSFSQAQQLISRSPEELQTQIGETNRMRPGLEIPGARAFQDFVSKMEEAGAAIKTTLTNQVVALAGPLGNLTQQVTGLLQSFIKWALSKDNIDALADGIKRLGDFLKNEDWAGDWQKFKTGLGDAVTALENFVGFLGKIGNMFGGKTAPGDAAPVPLPQQQGTKPSVGGWGFDWNTGKWRQFQGTDDDEINKRPTDPLFQRQDHWTPGNLFNPAAFHTGGRGLPIMATMPIPVEITGFRGFSEQKEKPQPEQPPPWAGMIQQAAFRVPAANDDDMTGADLISRIAKVESNFNPLAVSPAGAQGLMQFMPETWKRFGQGSPFNPIEAIRAAQRYLAHLFSMPELGGDPAKVVASYNAGEGAVTAAIRKFGADWLSHLPQETQNYVPKVLGRSQSDRPDFHPVKPPHVGVTIQNETGGNVVTTHRLLAT